MKGLRYAIAAAGLIGAAAMFLPYWPGGGGGMWEYRKVEALAVYLPMGGFALAACMGALAFVTGGLSRAQAGISLLGFGFAFLSEWVRKGFTADGGIEPIIGGKLLFAAAVAGMACSLISLARPEKR